MHRVLKSWIKEQKATTANLVLRGVGDDTIVEKKWPTISDARLTSINNEILYGYKKLKKNKGITGTPVKIYRGDQMKVIRPQ